MTDLDGAAMERIIAAAGAEPSYRGRPSYTFFSPHISGAQRLWSENTLICEGQWGAFSR